MHDYEIAFMIATVLSFMPAYVLSKALFDARVEKRSGGSRLRTSFLQHLQEEAILRSITCLTNGAAEVIEDRQSSARYIIPLQEASNLLETTGPGDALQGIQEAIALFAGCQSVSDHEFRSQLCDCLNRLDKCRPRPRGQSKCQGWPWSTGAAR